MRLIAAYGLALLLASAACSSEEAALPSPTPERCEMPVGTPDGFSEKLSEDVEQGPTLGVRTFFDGPRNRHIVYTAGVLMDFFEEPADKKLQLEDGSDAWLFGSSGDRWVLFWRQPDACQQYSIGGQGFSRREFLQQVRELGLLPSD